MIMERLENAFTINSMLDLCEINRDEFVQVITDALDEIGIYEA